MLTYDSFVTSVANLIVIPPTNADYLTVVPNIIDDVEQRMYRELDLLGTITRTSTIVLSTQDTLVTLPTSVTFVVLDSINTFTPVGTTTVRNPLSPVSLEWINAVYPQITSSSSTFVPAYFAMVTDQTFVVAPPPGSPYNLEVVGSVRPTALSSGNSSTYLTQRLPDAFLAGGCMFAAGYLKNFGAQTDDPRSGISWEQHFTTLMQSANVEENRKKFRSEGWTSKNPSPLATPPRQ